MSSAGSAIPTWARRALLGLVAGVLLLVLVGLALLLPYVPRLARAGAALPDAVRVVERAPETLEQVERIDGNVSKVVPPVIAVTEDLTALSPQLAARNQLAQDLRGDVERLRTGVAPLTDSAAELAELGDDLAGLQARLDSLGTDLAALQELGQPVQQLADSAGPLPASLERLNTSTAVLQELPGFFGELSATLVRVERHVANLDRKTGPAPPAPPRPRSEPR